MEVVQKVEEILRCLDSLFALGLSLVKIKCVVSQMQNLHNYRREGKIVNPKVG
jgi:hypothetical protein